MPSDTRQQDSRQRAQIQTKYESLYGMLKACADAVVEGEGNHGIATFRRLKETLPAVWALLMEQKGVPLSQLLHMTAAFNARPCTWHEGQSKVEGTEWGWDQASVRVTLDAIKAHIPANCDLVMDLGCGWGHRMVDLYLAGGPKAAAYRGGERAAPGRALIALLGRVLPEMDIGSFAFDFLAPDFSAVEGKPRSICVYTYLAIEQVRYLGPELFDKLLERFPDAEITGVHMEPFGFQAFAADDPRFAADREYAAARGYNLDLFAQVVQHPRLKVLAATTPVLGQGQGNGIGALVWRRRT